MRPRADPTIDALDEHHTFSAGRDVATKRSKADIIGRNRSLLLTAELISSDKNPLLRDLRKALTRGELTADGHCVAESFHLLAEAIRSDLPVKVVIAAQSALVTVQQHLRDVGISRFVTLPDALFAALATTESTQGVMALVKVPEWSLDQLFTRPALTVVLDAIQDPGNAGNIVRTAEAFGASGVIFPKGTVSPFNSKTLRASAGSLFRVPFAAGVEAQTLLATLRRRQLTVYAAMPRAKKSITETDLTRPLALVVGSEGQGVSPLLQELAVPVRIPTQAVESLNAAMAAGIVLYEAARQRSRASNGTFAKI
jgi:TrmH family RNA methyltransferase